MTLARMEHSGNASPTTLQIAINSAAASIVAVSGVGFPTGAVGTFVIVIDPDLANEEKILCNTRSINTFSVAPSGRGWDGTTAADHSSNAQIKHVFTANEADDFNDHIYGTSGTLRDDHLNYLTVARHDITARHTFGAAFAIPTAASVSAVGDGAGPGVATGPARADHIHGREPFAVGATVAEPPGTAAADGTSLSPARADHAHARSTSETFTSLTTGSLTATTITTGAVTVGGATVMPPGVIQMYGASGPPTGWLLCDGSPVSRTTYAALFAVIASTYGDGDHSTTFNLPNLCSRTPVGQGTGAGLSTRSVGQAGGVESVALSAGQNGAHNHTGLVGGDDRTHIHVGVGVNGWGAGPQNGWPVVGAASSQGLAGAGSAPTVSIPSLSQALFESPGGMVTGGQNTNHLHGIASDGSGTAHENMPPWLVLAFIIKT